MAGEMIGLKDLRTKTEKYIEQVKKGESFIVYRRSTPLFAITPINETWEEVIDFTKLKKGGVDINDLLARM